MPNSFHNYAQPVTAIQSISAEVFDPSLQVQARDEEIELLHMQIECLQQVIFPEFVTTNSQITALSISSLGAACTKHLLQAFVDLGSECQAGIYCPECAELCPLSANTVIHHCQNCAESYCLLCAHEHGYCLTCEADPDVWNAADPLPCPTEVDNINISPDQPPIETRAMASG